MGESGTARGWRSAVGKGALAVFLLVALGLVVLAIVNWRVAESRDRPVVRDRLGPGDRIQLREVYRLKRTLGDRVWPDLGEAPMPVILYNDRYAFLVGADGAPPGWTEVDGDAFEGAPYYRRPEPEPTAFAVRIGDRWAAGLRTRETMNRENLSRAREELPPVIAQLVPYPIFTFDRGFHAVLVLHEGFHAFQATRAPERFRRARSVYDVEPDYPSDDPAFSEAWNREGAALSGALEAERRSGACAAVRRFLSLRRERREAVDSGSELVRFESELEWLEGLAKYAEIRFYELAATVADSALAGDYDASLRRWSDEFRRLRSSLGVQEGDFRFYLSGLAQARILDRVRREWKAGTLTSDRSLEGMLAESCDAAGQSRSGRRGPGAGAGAETLPAAVP